MTTPEVLGPIRQRRMKKSGRVGLISQRYADPAYIYEDLEKSGRSCGGSAASSSTPSSAPWRRPLKRFCVTTSEATRRALILSIKSLILGNVRAQPGFAPGGERAFRLVLAGRTRQSHRAVHSS